MGEIGGKARTRPWLWRTLPGSADSCSIRRVEVEPPERLRFPPCIGKGVRLTRVPSSAGEAKERSRCVEGSPHGRTLARAAACANEARVASSEGHTSEIQALM